MFNQLLFCQNTIISNQLSLVYSHIQGSLSEIVSVKSLVGLVLQNVSEAEGAGGEREGTAAKGKLKTILLTNCFFFDKLYLLGYF